MTPEEWKQYEFSNHLVGKGTSANTFRLHKTAVKLDPAAAAATFSEREQRHLAHSICNLTGLSKLHDDFDKIKKELLGEIATSTQRLEDFKRVKAALDGLQIPKPIALTWSRVHQQFMPGESLVLESTELFDKIGDAKFHDNKNLLKVMLKIAFMLEILDRANLVHRDLKAENIMVDNKLNLTLIDFGLALIKGKTKAELKTIVDEVILPPVCGHLNLGDNSLT